MKDGKITLSYLQQYIRTKDHHPEALDGYFLKLIEETGELSRAIRKGLRPAADGQIKETIEEELWDVLYYVLAIANCYGIEIETVIPTKEEINNRKYQTGIRFSPT